ncbi:aldehyde dehydrogenase family protein [Rhodococcus sp. WS4]|nr:aldehyde dehydrogenase family protein [Rhodococcus sp. WS4]
MVVGHRVVPLVESLWSVTRSSLRDGPPTTPVRHARAAATLPHRIHTTPWDLPSEAGLPDGVLNVVCGSGQDVGEALVRHPAVSKISFTGSLRTGRAIGRIAADRVVPCTLELGGKSANIVFADADLDLAAGGSMVGFVGLAGQMCIAGSRILVQRGVYDEFLDKLVAVVSQVRPGIELSPIVTPAQFTQVQKYFQTATNEGAVARVGGRTASGETVAGGLFVEPTVYTDVNPDMRIMREEIFGPVTAVMPFDDEDDAIRLANDTEFGLYAGIWTTDVSRAHRVPRHLQAGTVTVNEYLMDHVETPFGGFKKSGIGREKGLEALHHYTQVKTVTIRL